MEKSTAGIAPKSATGKEAWEHLSFRVEEDANIVSPEDLGYGELHDLGYEVTDHESASAVEEGLIAQKLAQKALVRASSFRGRRSSIGSRASIGSACSRRESFGSRGGTASAASGDEEATIHRRR